MAVLFSSAEATAGAILPNPSHAAAFLRDGKLVAFPTETVYGLGADATAPQAVARIYAAKGRPNFNPLIGHVASRAAAEREGVLSGKAGLLAEAFWPGPLTLVVPRRKDGRVCDLACAGLDSIALRVPSHPVALAILETFNGPVAAPSANRSGRVSPTEARHVVSDLGDLVDLVLDGGPCRIGLESTIIDCRGEVPTLLRPGGIPTCDIEAAIGPLSTASSTGITAPGMLASHYAPRARLRLQAETVAPGEVGLDFGRVLQDGVLDLSPRGDPQEAAANLYRYLRRLDARGLAVIAVAAIPNAGLGAAINDRLRRAAAPRGEPTSA